MKDNKLNILFKILENQGYPNPRLDIYMKAIGYNGEWFLHDLVEKFGMEGARKFIKKTLSVLSKEKERYYSITLPLKGYETSWVELIIYDFDIDFSESDVDIVINSDWGESRIQHPDGTVKTLEELSDEADMGEFADFEDFHDEIRGMFYDYISKRCGFGIWYQ